MCVGENFKKSKGTFRQYKLNVFHFTPIILNMFLALTIAAIFCSTANSISIDDSKQFLLKYGYLNVSENELNELSDEEYLDALVLFQEYFNITSDGELNNETVKLIKTPRCGDLDEPSPYLLHYYKWRKNILKWHFVKVNHVYKDIAKNAFDIWSKHANVKFIYNSTKPDIVISFEKGRHRCVKKNELCSMGLDGVGKTLAHAFYPKDDQSTVEIHLDSEENWNHEMLLSVLIHEIGHALGIFHSNDEEAIMYPFFNSAKITLGSDDVNAIQKLFGSPISSTTPKTTTSTTTTTTRAVISPASPSPSSSSPPDSNESLPDLCNLTNELNTFLIINDVIYVFYERWVWIKKLTDDVFQKPLSLIKVMPFLPKNFKNISAIYQRPSGNVILFVDNYFYDVEFPSLKLNKKQRFYYKINAAVVTNTGRTYLFHDDFLVAEYSDCNLSEISKGILDKTFPGIPMNVESAFRYIDGYLYFFKANTYYKYSEHLNLVTAAGPMDLSLFNIHCPNISILQQLKLLINNLLKN